MYVILAEITPVKPNGSLETIRMSSKDSPSSVVLMDGQTWLPLITERPAIELKLTDSGLLSQAEISYGSLSFHISDVLGNSVWSTYDFTGALCRIWWGTDTDDFADYQQVFEGTVSSLSRETFTGTLNLLGSESSLTQNLLSATYAGTGGAEGPAGIKGTLKPWVSGPVFGISPVLVDPAYLIYQVHGYGAVSDITSVYEMAQKLADPVATVQTFAQLAALTLTPGQWAKAPEIGMFRLGGQPSQKVTVDVDGALNGAAYPNTVSGIIQHLIQVSNASATFGNLSLFNSTSWCFYTAEQTSIGDVVRQAALDAGGYLISDGLGVWHLGDFYTPKAPTTLTSNRTSLPLVTGFRESVVRGPIYKVRVGHSRCWSVHSDGEISPAFADLTAYQAGIDQQLDQFATEIETAQSELTVATQRLNDMTLDSILDRAEKKYWITEYARLNSERTEHVNEANEYGLTQERDALNTAFNSLTSYLNGLSPAWNSTNANTTIDRTVFRSSWLAVYNSVITLKRAVSQKAAETAIWSDITGSGKPEDGATVGAPLGTAIGGVPVQTVLDKLENVDGIPNRLSLALTQSLEAKSLTQIAALVGAQLDSDKQADRLSIHDEDLFDLDQKYTAQQSSIAVLVSEVGDAQSRLTMEETTRASQFGALTSQTTNLLARLNNVGGSGLDLEAKITATETAVVNESQARASSVQNLTTLINTETSNRSSAISLVNTSISNEAGTRASQIAGINSRLNNFNSTGLDLEANYTSLIGTQTTDRNAAVAANQVLTARLQNFNGTGVPIESTVNQLNTAIADANAARATAITQLTSTVDQNNATLTQSFNTVSNRTGVVEAKAVLTTNVNGHISGWQLANGGAGNSSFGVLANNFFVVNDAGQGSLPFQVIGGVTYINSAVIQDLMIGTNKLAINSVTVVHNATIVSAVSGTGYGNFSTLISYTINAPVNAGLVFIVSGQQGFPSGDRRWEGRLKVNGNIINSGGGAKTSDTFSLAGSQAVGTGLTTVEVDWSGDTTVSLVSMNLVILETRR